MPESSSTASDSASDPGAVPAADPGVVPPDIRRRRWLAIVTGAFSILIGVLYLLLILVLDSRGPLLPPPPEALGISPAAGEAVAVSAPAPASAAPPAASAPHPGTDAAPPRAG